MDQSNIEKLAFAQAVYQAAAEMVGTKQPGNLRGEADDYYKGLYQMTGAKSFDVRIGDDKVGTFSLTVSKPTESAERTDFEVYDGAALNAWATADGDHGIGKAFLMAHIRDFARFYFEATGELPDGCHQVTTVVPGEAGGEVTRTSLRIDRESVINALGNRLAASSAALLGGGGDD